LSLLEERTTGGSGGDFIRREKGESTDHRKTRDGEPKRVGVEHGSTRRVHARSPNPHRISPKDFGTLPVWKRSREEELCESQLEVPCLFAVSDQLSEEEKCELISLVSQQRKEGKRQAKDETFPPIVSIYVFFIVLFIS